MSPTQAGIERKLKTAFSPTHLEVINESHRHSVPAGSETHFKLVVVTPNFEGKGLLVRHREIYQQLDEEIKIKGVHALALHAFTPAEWEKQQNAHASPVCQGGAKKPPKD